MEKNLIKKGLVFGIILIFVGINIIPIKSGLLMEKDVKNTQICKNDLKDENDTTPPVTTIYFDPPEPNGLNDWYVTDIEITLEATDDISGVDFIKYLLDDNDWMIYTVPLIIKSDGYHRITYYAVDKAGNVEQPSEVIRFKLDKTKPVISMNYTWEGNQMTGYEFTFTATATDNMSGMECVEFYFNNVLQKTITGDGPDYIWGPVMFPPCDILVKAVAYDKAGKDNHIDIENPTNYENNKSQFHSKTIMKQELVTIFYNLFYRIYNNNSLVF